MTCNSCNSNINKTFILEPIPVTAGVATFSACTALYTNQVHSCSGNTAILMGTNLISFNSDLSTNGSIIATTYYGDGSQLSGISTDNFYTTASTLIDTMVYFDRTDTLSAYTLNLSGFVSDNFYTTGGTLIDTSIYFDRTDILSAYTINLNGLDSRYVNVTGDTMTGRLNGTSIWLNNPSVFSGYTLAIEATTEKVATYRDSDGEDVFYFDVNLASETLDIGIGDYVQAYNYGAYRINRVSGTTYHRLIDGNVYIGDSLTFKPTEKLYVDGDVKVDGNITILGSATTIHSTVVEIDDNIITLAANQTGSTAPVVVNSGFDILRNSATTASLIWSEANTQWEAGLNGSTERIILASEFASHTGDTNNPHQTTFSGLTNRISYTNVSTTTIVDSFSSSIVDGCQWIYTIKDSPNVESGTIIGAWDVATTAITNTQYSTNEIGSTSGITFDLTLSGSNVYLIANVINGNWGINLRRLVI